MLASTAGQKRWREDDDIGVLHGHPACSKKVRPTPNAAGVSEPWDHDAVIEPPTTSSQKPKYDSDDQSSMLSEPGSPQEADSSADDDMEVDLEDSAFSQLLEDALAIPPKPGVPGSSPSGNRVQGRNRVATPFRKPLQLRTCLNSSHVRERHLQENGSGHLEVPSPVNEAELPTPPSAAEAAGSQLSMLSVNDMDILTAADLPSITIDPARNLPFEGNSGSDARLSPGLEAMSSRPDAMVRKGRQRSGAQSNGSVSPVRLGADREMSDLGGLSGASSKRGFSMGYRADCEKCRMRVPGHMNHFVL